MKSQQSQKALRNKKEWKCKAYSQKNVHSFSSLKPKKDASIKDNESEVIAQNNNLDNEINISAASVNDNFLNVDMQVQFFIHVFVFRGTR